MNLWRMTEKTVIYTHNYYTDLMEKNNNKFSVMLSLGEGFCKLVSVS